MSKTSLRIGLFGFGCVGQGLYDVLNKTNSLHARIEKICVKHPGKKRSLPEDRFTYDRNDLLFDRNIDVIVELIDDAQEAFEIVKTALLNGKAVVSANKKMIAEHFRELYRLQQETGLPVLYEGSVCGAIPILRTLEEYYDNELLNEVEGIFNGTTNYILTKTFDEHKSYEEVLQQAQELGFAESNPRLDVQGFDPKYKLVVLATHAFGLFINPDEVLNIGIHLLNEHDTRFAREKGLKLRLVPHIRRVGKEVRAYVIPRFVKADDLLYNVQNEFNAVSVQAAFSDKQFFTGRGAGSHPTAAAVLSDISALSYDYRYGYKKIAQGSELTFTNDFYIRAYIRYENDGNLQQLHVKEIEESFRSNTHRYIVGKVRISDLIHAGLNEQQDLFVIEIPETGPQKLLREQAVKDEFILTA